MGTINAKMIEPLNPMPDGTCRTLKSQYYKNSIANFTREGAYAATAVIEYEEDAKTEEHIRALKNQR